MIDDLVRPLWAKVRNKPYLEDLRSKNANTVHYTDASGRVATVALGADNTVLTSTGLTTAPAFETVTATGKGAQERIVNDVVSVPEATPTTITWEADEEVFDDASFFSAGAPTIFTVPDAGLYYVSASGALAVGPATTWVTADIEILTGGAFSVAFFGFTIEPLTAGGSAVYCYLQCAGVVRLAATNTVKVVVTQTNGGAAVALNFSNAYFNIAKLGS